MCIATIKLIHQANRQNDTKLETAFAKHRNLANR